jgi:hypothetical protein
MSLQIELFEAILLSKHVSYLKNKGLSSESLFNLLKLRKETKEMTENHNKSLIEIMQKWDVAETVKGSGNYNWDNHPKTTDITADILALQKIKQDINNIKFMTQAELHSASEGLDTETILNLSEWLLKDTLKTNTENK